MSENIPVYNLLAIICAIVFGIITVLLPLLNLFGFILLGGFLQYSSPSGVTNFFWFGLRSPTGIIMPFNSMFPKFQPEILWTILPLWGIASIILAIIGTIGILVPAFSKIIGKEPTNFRMAKFGLIAGLFGTIIQWLLFLIGWLLIGELWSSITNLNILLLGAYLIAWFALFIGYWSVSKD
ncbi:MAG: hypothetical protein ACFFC7_15820 [Candidatus Hermodarchaeota archaeon]